MEDEIKKIQKAIEDIPVIKNDIAWIKEHLKSNGFVKREEFTPVKRIVYGSVGLILTAVLLGGMSFLLTPVLAAVL